MAGDDSRPVVMLELLCCRVHGGRECYLRHLEAAGPLVGRHGAEIVYVGALRWLSGRGRDNRGLSRTRLGSISVTVAPCRCTPSPSFPEERIAGRQRRNGPRSCLPASFARKVDQLP